MLVQRFLAFINENRLFGPSDRVLLAVSGGLDSVAMVDLFRQAGQPFAVAHVNFGLRGDESAADAAFVENMARQAGVPFHSTHFDTVAVAARRGCSIQMAARDLRYNWFSQLLADHNYACVATAHHQNDVLETLLLNLTRGTGLAGLHGIAPRQGEVVRPLLFASRDELAAFVDERGLLYREDSSNADDKYARNRIRHYVVPVLTALNPNLIRETLPRTVERLRAAEALMDEELQRSWQAVAVPDGDRIWLPAPALLALSELPFRLAAWLKPYGFSVEQTAAMASALSRATGQVFRSATHCITHERDGLLLEALTVRPVYNCVLTDWPTDSVDVNGQFLLDLARFEKPADFRPSPSPLVACLDADRLVFPLIIRPWQLGDRFRPLGMTGSRLVSDLLNDLKLTRPERGQTAVLVSGGQIAWVIGRRIDHRFRITGPTRQIAQFTCRNW